MGHGLTMAMLVITTMAMLNNQRVKEMVLDVFGFIMVRLVR